MKKSEEVYRTKMTPDISIRLLRLLDIPVLVDVFQKAHWPKFAELFETYHQEQLQNERFTWVALTDKKIAGYVSLVWNSKYKPFSIVQIPEIMDLNVLPSCRKFGIGSKLLEVCEKEAFTRSDKVGIGVGLYGGFDGGYGAAQRLYVKHGYVPDGRGVTYDYKPATPGEAYPVDDSLCLWLIKNQRSNHL